MLHSGPVLLSMKRRLNALSRSGISTFLFFEFHISRQRNGFAPWETTSSYFQFAKHGGHQATDSAMDIKCLISVQYVEGGRLAHW